LDQSIKWLVETRLVYEELVPVVPFLGLYRTWNEGIAFSFFEGLPDVWLVVLTVFIIGFVLYLWSRTPASHLIARIGFALIIGGALGNLIDRALLGYVVDYILFHTPVWSFAVFNLADAFISAGAALILLQEVIEWRRSRAG
jgi:signal peptidase II